MTPLSYARAETHAATDRLMDFLRIPSVSTVPELGDDVQEAAKWVADRLTEAGAQGVRIDPTPRHPVVFGSVRGPADAPTVLVYGHYDVQPTDPDDLWQTPPFEPTVRDGCVYARGASDDKGQLLIHLEALAAFTNTVGRPPVSLKFVIEGEEEIGSPNLDAWLRAHAAELQADVAVVSDTAMLAADQPSIVYGLRGLAYLEVVLKGPARDLHSGQFGGAVLNPAHVLSRIIAQLHDDGGRVTIPGFYDAVRPLDEDERDLLSQIPFDEDTYRQAAGVAADWGEAGYSIVERLGARPTLDVNGLWSGWTGAGAKTVLPSEAAAKISMRLVPDQNPDEIVGLCGDYIRELAGDKVQVEIRPLHGASPAIVDRDSPAIRAASKGYETAFGRAPVFSREGGTIPVVASLEMILGLPTVLMGFGLPDDNLHAPNEKFCLDNFTRGIEAVISFLEELPQEWAQ
jgi:acetylornithine deacetylase/succinyl-diaminopimelate desuccinylase-like protein